MNLTDCNPSYLVSLLRVSAATVATALVTVSSVYAEKIYSFDDQHIQIEARTVGSEARTAFGVEISLTPRPGWKLLASNSSSVNPLKLRFSPGKCLQLKGGPQQSAPDWSGTDDSGAFSEYHTKTATIKQEFTRIKCADKKGFAASGTLSYLLCQDNRCVGPFSREFRFTAPSQK